jgi:hypothetical protein
VEADTALENIFPDEYPAALAAFQEILFNQLLVGQHHRVPGDPELFGQLAR